MAAMKIVKRLAMMLLVLAVLAVSYVYAVSEWTLQRHYDDTPQPVSAQPPPTPSNLPRANACR